MHIPQSSAIRLDKNVYILVAYNRSVGGEGGIRTHGTREGTTVFETAPIDHSGTSPYGPAFALNLIDGGAYGGVCPTLQEGPKTFMTETCLQTRFFAVSD